MYMYEDSVAVSNGDGLALVVFFVAYFAILGVALAFALASYILQGLSFYGIAKRRQIKNSWLAWLPFGNVWILGSISDQYQYVVKGKVTNRRKILLGLLLGEWAIVFVLYIVLFCVTFISALAGMEFLPALLLIPLDFIIIGMSIAALVFQYLAYYDLFASCYPERSVLYFVLSIVVSFALPICLILCYKKDLGMPPRKQEPTEEIPAEPETAAPAESPEEAEPLATEVPATEPPAIEE